MPRRLFVLVGLVGLLLPLSCAEPLAPDTGGGVDSGASDAGARATDGDPRDADRTADVPDADLPVDAGPPPPTAGLTLRMQYEVPIESGHLGEVTIHGTLAYVANSWDSFATVSLEPDGTIFSTLTRPAEPARARCTTLSIHDASSTLYCSSDESHEVLAYDLSDPEQPVLRDAQALMFPMLRVRDIQVAGDELFLARFADGLWVAPIDPAGGLGPAVQTEVTGNVRFVAEGGGHLVALCADRGLVVLDGAGAAVTIAAELALEGTPQDLSVRGDRAAVALGSAGAVVVDLLGAPTIVAQVRPQAVVTSADLDGDLLGLATLTGAYLYDLSVTPPRLAGYSASGRRRDRAGGVMLSGRFARGEFFTSDWTFVERFATDRTGHVVEIDMPRGLYVPAGAGRVLPFRNESDVPLALGVDVGSTHFDLLVPPGATRSGFIDGATLTTLLASSDPRIEATVTSAGPAGAVQIPVLLRPARAAPPRDHPARGDPFPEIHVATTTGVTAIPVAGRRSLLVFFARDCAAMWPVLEDATYLGARGELDGGATPFLLTESDIATDGYQAAWALGAADFGHHGYLAPREVVEFNGSERVYEDRFQIANLPRAASHPTNYLVGATGIVEAVDTYYRGAFPLR